MLILSLSESQCFLVFLSESQCCDFAAKPPNLSLTSKALPFAESGHILVLDQQIVNAYALCISGTNSHDIFEERLTELLRKHSSSSSSGRCENC